MSRPDWLRPGARVRVREDLKAGQVYGNGWEVTPGMERLAGETVRINPYGVSVFEDVYFIEGNPCHWHKDMFKPCMTLLELVSGGEQLV